MNNYKHDFIDFMVKSEVLTFGDFVTKSGRKTPFFVNTGKYRTGDQITKLGEFYAESIMENTKGEFDVLFGPAYKGIPLAVSASIALSSKFGKNVSFCFNRKEVKDHGEGGNLIGHKLQNGDRVLIIEDVTTAGTSIRETVPLLKAAADIELAALSVSVNRMERGTGDKSALDEIRDDFGMKTFSIVNMAEVVGYLYGRKIGGKVLIDDEMKSRIEDYYKIYGAK
ncbi:orotate phosphoribosyltransferase [bacterium]|nr:orotate phosphoribosyltransferase [bacterium]MBR6245479.1 orotate phosphoribosyltransferase [bacterium]